MTLKVIAYARNGHTDKFGIPRQSREESPILTRIVFEPEFSMREALRGIEGYSHLWILWGFSSRSHPSDTRQNSVLTEGPQALRSPQKLEIFGDPCTISWSPTVRPPRLGGNKRMGVFATRSPFRPNPIGLSSVRLLKAYPRPLPEGKGVRWELLVSGADVLDGTPIYDIKPYLSFSDSHPDARNGFAEETKNYHLEVDWGMYSPDYLSKTDRQWTENGPKTDRQWVDEVEYILRQDPRPGYQNDPEREYKMDYAGWRVTFKVRENKVIIRKIEQIL